VFLHSHFLQMIVRLFNNRVSLGEMS
jgi:hypothetical protein